jgi:NAD(P)-dependent dehydrogenase (short-subunit alcohol dehydrogenase family)
MPLKKPTALQRTWFVTGCSTGLGRALCRRLLEIGERVVCTARDVTKLADLAADYPKTAILMPLDVTNAGSIEAAMQRALALPGGVDVLVNNAGYGLVGALEEVDETAVKDAFDANVYGAYRLIRALLPHMRARGSGHILNVSSMAGFVGGAGFCFYSATKFALEGMSESLAKEVAPFGIKVVLIEPGPFRTDFRNRSMQSAKPMDVYAETVGRFRKMLSDTDGKQPGDPRRAADAMIAVVDAEHPPMRLPLGSLCVEQIRNKLAVVAGELDRWNSVSLSTSFDAGG